MGFAVVGWQMAVFTKPWWQLHQSLRLHHHPSVLNNYLIIHLTKAITLPLIQGEFQFLIRDQEWHSHSITPWHKNRFHGNHLQQQYNSNADLGPVTAIVVGTTQMETQMHSSAGCRGKKRMLWRSWAVAGLLCESMQYVKADKLQQITLVSIFIPHLKQGRGLEGGGQ